MLIFAGFQHCQMVRDSLLRDAGIDGPSFTLLQSLWALVIRIARQKLGALHTISQVNTHTHTTILWPFFQDHPGEPVPDGNFWTLWCKGRLTEADTLTIRLDNHLDYQCPPPPCPHIFLRAECPSCRPTNSVKALKAKLGHSV